MGKSWAEQQQQVERTWEQYGDDGLRLAYGLTGELALAQDLVYVACVETYRLLSNQRGFLGARNALLAAILQVYQVWTIQRVRNEEVSEAKSTVNNVCTLSAVGDLPVELKAPLLLYLVSGCSVFEITRILLLPHQWVLRRLGESARALGWLNKGKIPWTSVLETVDSYQERLSGEVANIRMSAEVENRVHQLVVAAAAMVAADKRQFGSNGVRFAFAAVIALGAGLTGYGIDGWHQAQRGIATGTTLPTTAKGLPEALRNLPVDIVAQFRLASGSNAISLHHMAAANNGIYQAKLELPTNSWPYIDLSLCPYSASGKWLQSYQTSAGRIDMVPPLTNPKIPTGTGDWTVKNWQVRVTADWMVAWVQWQPGTSGGLPVTQVYLMYLPTHRSALVQSLELSKGRDILALAVGSGRVVEQYGFHTSSSSTAGISGLPISVYSLHGKVPLQALGKPAQIPAPFGMMEDAEVRRNELIFQGIVGQSPGVSDKATWYSLAWDGQLTKLAGPPLDGQSHWALRGVSGRLWWVETTPASGGKHQWQVLMGEVSSPAGLNQTAAFTLNGSVNSFTVSDNRLVWIQATEGVSQLVVAEPS